MSRTFEEYLANVEKYGDPFPTPKSILPDFKFKIIGPNNNLIDLKKAIGLNYFSTYEHFIIYIEDISPNKQFSEDLKNKNFILYLSSNILYIDFCTDYYYELYDFNTFEQFNYCQKHKQLTLALLNNNSIINKWTTNVNLL